ncbi:MAG: GNAT family N-acetyltransferase [Chloroflexi bacterium]|nr:GNAT family N-acetyltransferase [Chloroflexota bacterium]
MPNPITTRPITPADDPLVLAIYHTTREPELALTDWSAAQKAAFVAMQFQAQRQDYQHRFPQADYDLIMAGDEPVGYVYVMRGQEEMRLLDIAMAPAWRNQGVGTAVLRELMAEAAASQRPLSYMVLRTNEAALRLYQRLGFQQAGLYGHHYLMVHRADRVNSE